MPKKKLLKPTRNRVSTRKHRYVFALNDLENKALCKYIAKYKVKNKSKFIRETILIEVIRRMDQDAPTLFDEVNG
jgi:hypothetical protein